MITTNHTNRLKQPDPNQFNATLPINKKRRKQRFYRLRTSGFSSHPSYQNSQAYNKNCALSLKCINKTLPKRPSWREKCTAFCLLPHTHITYLHYSINTSKVGKSTSKQNKKNKQVTRAMLLDKVLRQKCRFQSVPGVPRRHPTLSLSDKVLRHKGPFQTVEHSLPQRCWDTTKS